MNTIMGYAELLAERVEDPELEAFADSIIRTAVGLASMAENVRRLQDVVEEGAALDQTTDVTPQLEAAVDWIRESHPLADISVDAFESSVMVHGTPKLRIAFQEVLENAVEHANRPQPAVSIETETSADQIQVTVEDEGPGIPEHERSVLTGHEKITPLTHGSGLGLWTVKWIVEAAQGTVDIETDEQRGSTVTITLQRAHVSS
jgi:signal transduction histidine kinase